MISVYNPPAVRELLTATRTYFVSTTGSDSNNGLSSGNPFLTIGKALSTIISMLDTAGFTVTISLADGTYTENVVISSTGVGAGAITITGTNTTGAILSPAAGNNFTLGGNLVGVVTVQKLKFINNNSGICINHGGIGKLVLGANIEFGSATGGYHMQLSGPSVFVLAASGYTISGGAFTHLYCASGAFAQVEGSTVTLSGTPAFSGQFLWTPDAGLVRITTTFSGSATGTRYTMALNSVAIGNGSGTSYLPGDAAGSTATGAQYGL